MIDTKHFYVIGHRGNEKYDPENTMPAFSRAIEAGADFIELDVRLSSDRKVLVFHDSKLNRLTELDGKFCKFTSDQLFQTPVLGPDGSYTSHIPTLEEVLSSFGNRVSFIVEMKAPRMAREVGGLLSKTCGFEDVIVDSFNWKWISRIKQLFPGTITSYLVHHGKKLDERRHFEKLAGKLRKIGASGVSLPFGKLASVGKSPVSFLQDQGFFVLVWGVRDPSHYAEAIKLGVNGFTAGDPFLAVKLAGELLQPDVVGRLVF
ncbi:MAG: glycerophosphodiester phosphodiesterase [Promethearchaeota archaeon]